MHWRADAEIAGETQKISAPPDRDDGVEAAFGRAKLRPNIMAGNRRVFVRDLTRHPELQASAPEVLGKPVDEPTEMNAAGHVLDFRFGQFSYFGAFLHGSLLCLFCMTFVDVLVLSTGPAYWLGVAWLASLHPVGRTPIFERRRGKIN